jgi:hypothetical protein
MLIAASHLPGLLLLLLCFLLYILLLVCYREDYQCIIYVYPPAPFVSYPPPHHTSGALQLVVPGPRSP